MENDIFDEMLASTEATKQSLINRMTNWQNHQASRACKGKWRDLSIEQAHQFANMRR